MMCFYCLNHLVCGTLYWQAWKMNTVFGTEKKSYTERSGAGLVVQAYPSYS